MEFRVDFTSENILPDGSNFGYVGEHNAATLVITPPSSMADNAEIKYICLACEVGKDFVKSVVRSELYEKAAEIRVPLWVQATVGESAKLQLEGYDGNENILIKSELVNYVLSPSAGGTQTATDLNGNSLAATVAANTERIKDFEGKDLLPKVTEDDNGKFLMVSEGAWAAVAVPSAEEAVF